MQISILNPKTEAANCSYTEFCKPEIVQRQGQNVRKWSDNPG
jgi:hypothetical protein